MMGNTRVRGGKSYGTDLGIRVPMYAYWKGTTPSGKVSKDLIDSVDFLPTILDVAGATSQQKTPVDGVSFKSVLTGEGNSPRDWVYIHQDPRPGWDKDRFRLIRLAREARYKLYEDGRLFDMQDDPFERQPITVANDSPPQRAARVRLQGVLDSMKPYPHFDPSTMPRPNPRDAVENFEFHDQGGFIVVEPEMLRLPLDESWVQEPNLPGYTGLGYLRALRDQPLSPKKDSPQSPGAGATVIHLNALTAGQWSLAFRGRCDHVDSSENKLWVKVADGPWLIAELSGDASPGVWTWITRLRHPKTKQLVPATFEFTEKRNDVTIAPYSQNFKVDRIVAFESDRKEAALDPQSPVSPFHPWASP